MGLGGVVAALLGDDVAAAEGPLGPVADIGPVLVARVAAAWPCFISCHMSSGEICEAAMSEAPTLSSGPSDPWVLTSVASDQGLWPDPWEAFGVGWPVETSIGTGSVGDAVGSVWPAAALPEEASADTGLEYST